MSFSHACSDGLKYLSCDFAVLKKSSALNLSSLGYIPSIFIIWAVPYFSHFKSTNHLMDFQAMSNSY